MVQRRERAALLCKIDDEIGICSPVALGAEVRDIVASLRAFFSERAQPGAIKPGRKWLEGRVDSRFETRLVGALKPPADQLLVTLARDLIQDPVNRRSHCLRV